MKKTTKRPNRSKLGPPHKICPEAPGAAPHAAPQLALEPFDALKWTDAHREIQRSLAELHQLAARCQLAQICRELLPEAKELAQRGRPRLLATLARILAEPALDVALPPSAAGDAAHSDDSPMQIELIHNVSRPIHSLEQLKAEQQRLDAAREKLLTK